MNAKGAAAEQAVQDKATAVGAMLWKQGFSTACVLKPPLTISLPPRQPPSKLQTSPINLREWISDYGRFVANRFE